MKNRELEIFRQTNNIYRPSGMRKFKSIFTFTKNALSSEFFNFHMILTYLTHHFDIFVVQKFFYQYYIFNFMLM